MLGELEWKDRLVDAIEVFRRVLKMVGLVVVKVDVKEVFVDNMSRSVGQKEGQQRQERGSQLLPSSAVST
jgi:tRNA G46 methylase TrmB